MIYPGEECPTGKRDMELKDTKDTVVKTDGSTAKHSRVIDTVAKILCVIGAFSLWFYVMQNDVREYEETIAEVPVSLVNSEYIEDQYNLSVYSGYGNLVDVTVIGKQSVVTKLTADDIKVYADLGNISESGNYSLEIKTETPSGVTLGSLSYNTISVYADVKDVRTVEVRADIASISVPSQYEIGKLEPSVDSVTVTGPKAALENIAYARVALTLGSVSGSTTAIGQLELIDSSDTKIDNPYVKLSRSEVTVKVPISTYKTVPVEYSFKYGYLDDSNSEITVTPSTVRIKGDPNELDAIKSIVLRTIDERTLGSDDVTITQPMNLPEGVVSADGIETVSVKVHLKNLIKRTFQITKMTVMGDTVPYEIIDEKVIVAIRATSKQMEVLDADKLVILLNLSGYAPDTECTMEVEGEVLFPSGIGEVFIIEPPTVKVKFN